MGPRMHLNFVFSIYSWLWGGGGGMCKPGLLVPLSIAACSYGLVSYILVNNKYVFKFTHILVFLFSFFLTKAPIVLYWYIYKCHILWEMQHKSSSQRNKSIWHKANHILLRNIMKNKHLRDMQWNKEINTTHVINRDIVRNCTFSENNIRNWDFPWKLGTGNWVLNRCEVSLSSALLQSPLWLLIENVPPSRKSSLSQSLTTFPGCWCLAPLHQTFTTLLVSQKKTVCYSYLHVS